MLLYAGGRAGSAQREHKVAGGPQGQGGENTAAVGEAGEISLYLDPGDMHGVRLRMIEHAKLTKRDSPDSSMDTKRSEINNARTSVRNITILYSRQAN